MNGDMTEFARRQERFRAMMIGLALGDARPARAQTEKRSLPARPPIWRCVNCTR